MNTHRTEHFDKEQNNEKIYLNLDLLKKTREITSKTAVEYQQRVARYYNQNVQVRQFKAGDWVLRKVIQITRNPNHAVFSPNWKNHIGFYKQQEQGCISWLVQMEKKLESCGILSTYESTSSKSLLGFLLRAE